MSQRKFMYLVKISIALTLLMESVCWHPTLTWHTRLIHIFHVLVCATWCFCFIGFSLFTKLILTYEEKTHTHTHTKKNETRTHKHTLTHVITVITCVGVMSMLDTNKRFPSGVSEPNTWTLFDSFLLIITNGVSHITT